MKDSRILLLVPDLPIYRSFPESENTLVCYCRRREGYLNDIHRMIELGLIIPSLERKFAADVCLSLGDLAPLSLKCKQVTFLHQALLVYNQNEISVKSTWPLHKSIILRQLIKYTVKKSQAIIVQTPVMADRLALNYPGEKKMMIDVIPTPPPKYDVMFNNNALDIYYKIMNCGKPNRLLFLAVAYPHKNHDILTMVSKELERRCLSDNVQIFVTLDDSIINSSRMRKKLSTYSNTITNLGYLRREEVRQAMKASTSLFIPSLAESYGNIYLEAMYHQLPILTSDRDFARWICRDMALYFDPLNPTSIVDAIEASIGFPENREKYAAKVDSRLKELPQSWREVANKFAEVLYRVVGTI